jgi:hypothetical protein
MTGRRAKAGRYLARRSSSTPTNTSQASHRPCHASLFAMPIISKFFRNVPSQQLSTQSLEERPSTLLLTCNGSVPNALHRHTNKPYACKGRQVANDKIASVEAQQLVFGNKRRAGEHGGWYTKTKVVKVGESFLKRVQCIVVEITCTDTVCAPAPRAREHEHSPNFNA